MTDVFLVREFDPPLTDESFEEMSADAAHCFDLYRVQWMRSFMSNDGRRLICCFSAPDTESTRQALRKARNDSADPWPGTIHESAAADPPSFEEANVLVERRFDEPVAIEEIQAIEDAGIACLEARNVAFVRTFFSRDRKRMLCLYRAPDAESVREAQRMAGLPFEKVWAFKIKENQ